MLVLYGTHTLRRVYAKSRKSKDDQHVMFLNCHRNRPSPTEMLKELGWLSLEERRRQQRLTILFKIVNGIVAIDADQYLTPLFHTHKLRYHHSQVFVVPHSNTEYQQSSFLILARILSMMSRQRIEKWVLLCCTSLLWTAKMV